MVSCCNRRLYKGNSYEICLPITDTGVTSVRFYTSGDMVIEKEGEIVDDTMCFELAKDELDLLPDGVLRYSYEGFDSNTEYVIVTPADYSGSTLDDLLEDAFDSGYTAGQEHCSGSSCNLQSSKTVYLGGFEWSYDPGDGWRAPRYMVSGSPVHISADTGYDGLEEIQLTGYFHPTEAYDDGYGKGFTSGYQAGREDCSGSTIDADLIANLQGDYFVIPEGTTRLRDWAFRISQNNGFSGIVIPNSVLYIGQYAFHGNFRLKDITIPSSVETIGNFAFNECSGLTAMTFEGVTPPTFAPNYPLGSSAYTFPIYVPCESVEAYKTAVGQNYAHRITCAGPEPQSAATAITITVPQDLEPGDTGSTSVSTSPTGATTNLSYTSSDNSVATVDNNGNITAVGTGTTYICVTDSISQITECAQLTINNPGPQPVTGTSLLTNIYRTDDLNPGFAPTSAVQLCNESFYSAITEMTIDGVSVTPSMTADFSSDAGKGGVRYHTVEYTINTPVVPELSFHNNTHLIHTVISGDCTGIGTEAFWLCEYLGCDSDRGYSGVVLSPNIVLGDAVFGYCTRIKDFEIPTANTVVPESLFYVCSGLTSVTIHSGVTVVSGRSFQQCHSLLSVELPAGLTEIGGSAFIHCRSLTEIRLLGTVPPTIHGSEVFSDTNNCPIYVPCESVNDYKTAWPMYEDRIACDSGSPTPVDYSREYFTLEVQSGNSASTLTIPSTVSHYRKNGGEWTVHGVQADITAQTGDIIEMKGQNTTIDHMFKNSSYHMPQRFKVYGNIMSLFYGDDFIGKTQLPASDAQQLSSVFGGTNVTDAENLVIPVTDFAVEYTCGYMFSGCYYLEKAPKILPATGLTESCYQSMFSSCNRLTNPPSLPATTMAFMCYYGMFENCTSLVTPPSLPATTLARSCYGNMFKGCTSLTVAPELPANTLEEACYASMFEGCTSLVKGPDLLAPVVPSGAYGRMFFGSAWLNSVKCLALDTSARGCAQSMLAGVSSTGTLIKHPNATVTTGVTGEYTWYQTEEAGSYEKPRIPLGWTVEDAQL